MKSGTNLANQISKVSIVIWNQFLISNYVSIECIEVLAHWLTSIPIPFGGKLLLAFGESC